MLSTNIEFCKLMTASEPPWSAIQTIMFDMDGTLLDLHFDNFFWQQYLPEAWAAASGLHLSEASARLERRYTELRGTLDWYCLDFWAKELQMPITPLKEAVKHKIAVRPKVVELLLHLRSLNKRLLLITNAHPDSLNLKMLHTGIDKYFDRTISAHQLRLAKENHGFWAALQDIEPYRPEHTLLVDDSLAVLRQAHREGIRYLYGIVQPDSKKAPLDVHEFPMITDFEQIMPPTSERIRK